MTKTKFTLAAAAAGLLVGLTACDEKKPTPAPTPKAATPAPTGGKAEAPKPMDKPADKPK